MRSRLSTTCRRHAPGKPEFRRSEAQEAQIWLWTVSAGALAQIWKMRIAVIRVQSRADGLELKDAENKRFPYRKSFRNQAAKLLRNKVRLFLLLLKLEMLLEKASDGRTAVVTRIEACEFGSSPSLIVLARPNSLDHIVCWSLVCCGLCPKHLDHRNCTDDPGRICKGTKGTGSLYQPSRVDHC